MFDAIGTALAWLYELTNNYGLAIMLLTLGLMVLLTPLTLKGTRSMIAMQRLQPEIKKLQSKYKDDRQKLNEEMLKFYKENDLNPVGGCLPLLLQAPVFFVLYRVLYGLTKKAPYGEDMGRQVALSAKQPGAVFENFGTFHPDHLDTTSKMYQDLSVSREMKSFGLDLAASASQTIGEGIVKALPYLVLIAVIGVTAWYQQRQIQGRNPQMAQQINPQQQMLMKIMPYFLPLISLTLPAGVVLYFLVSNLYRIGQQGFITRTMYRDSHGNPVVHSSSSKDSDEPRKGLLASLRETVDESGPRLTKASREAGKATAVKGSGGGTKTRTAPAKNQAGKNQAGKNQAAKNQSSKGQGTKSSTAPSRPAAPSRTAPEPNPNRSRAKKKRK